MRRCVDAAAWNNGPRPGGPLGCEDYVRRAYCRDGAVVQAWSVGAPFNSPELHCCACGGGSSSQPRHGAEPRPPRGAEPPPRATPCWDRNLEAPKAPWGSSAFCPRWPLPAAGNASAGDVARLRGLAQRALRPFASISKAQLDAAASPRCAQRLCLRVQIVRGQLFVQAPRSVACTSLRAGPCAAEQRRRQRGVNPNWKPGANPTRLEWHWAAGLNMSTCSVSVVAGDWNSAFSRLRLQSALRLLEEAASGAADTELLLCINETPLNAGGGCLRGAQPVFASTGNADAPLIPFIHWMPRLRDWDLSVWDDVRAEQRARRPSAASAARVAGFRGGLYRMGTYADEWRTKGARRTELNRANWRAAGRASLVHAKATAAASLLNVNVKHSGRWGRWPKLLGVPQAALDALDAPEALGFREQLARFRYTLNVEGHGGWADRLGHLLSSSSLVIAQDVPFPLWFEPLTAPGATHLVVDSNLRNLSAAVRWAAAHDAEVEAMVSRANAAMDVALSVAGIRRYVAELLAAYTERLAFAPALGPRSVRFACRPTRECRACDAPAARGRAERRHCGVRCAFRGADGREYDTLHEAGSAPR